MDRSEQNLLLQCWRGGSTVWGESRMAPCTDCGSTSCLFLMAPGTSGSGANCTSPSYRQWFPDQTCFCCACCDNAQAAPAPSTAAPSAGSIFASHPTVSSANCPTWQLLPVRKQTDRQTEQQQEPITLNRFTSQKVSCEKIEQ